MKANLKKLNPDKVLTIISVIYIILPVILFLMFWTKIWIGLTGSVFIVYGAINVIKELNENNDVDIIVKKNVIPIIVIFIVVFGYVLFSGIGGIGAQFGDFFVRNPLFYDLNHMKWPLVYNFASDNIISHIFNGEYLFVYYMAYWLPVSLIVKIFNLPVNVADILLMIYVFIGILLIMFNICKYLKCVKYVVLIFLFFSGIDILGGFIKMMVEWFWDNGFDVGVFLDLCKDYWDGMWNVMYFLAYRNLRLTYDDILLSIYNTFNQSICTYLTLSLFIRLKSNKHIAYLLSMIFAYSPWAMIGSMTYMIAGSLKKNHKFIKVLNIYNVIVPIIMFVVFGSYYVLSSATEDAGIKLVFFNKDMLLVALLSIVFEWGVYLLLVYDKKVKYDYFLATILNLLFFDIIYGNRNLNMRGSMPGIFFIVLYLIQYFIYIGGNKSYRVRKTILIICLMFSFFTPLANVWQGLQMIRNHTNITNPIKSFEKPRLYKEASETEFNFNVVKNQFFSDNYKDSIFYKYIMRK